MAGDRWDAIVVGGGAMGTATAWQLARRDRAVLLVERSTIGHERGSSHGPTRIFRLSYHHPDYVAMARRALEDWRELETAGRGGPRGWGASRFGDARVVSLDRGEGEVPVGGGGGEEPGARVAVVTAG